MNTRILHPRWRLTGIALSALLGLFFWTPASSTETPLPLEENETPIEFNQAALEVTGELTLDQQQTLIRESAAARLAEAREQLKTIETAMAEFDQRLKRASDGIENNDQALAGLRGRLDVELDNLGTLAWRLDTLGAQLKQSDEALKDQKSRLEDNSVKLYQTLIGINSAKKDFTLLRSALDQMRSAHAETKTQDRAGDADSDRIGLLLPLVLCLLVPLAVVINRGGWHATETGAKTEVKPVAWVLVAWFAGGAGFFLLGIGILYGPSLGGVIGNPAHFLGMVMLSAPADLPPELLKRLVPNLILASIVAVVACSSAPRELTNRGHFLVAVVAGALIYPLFGHWIATPTDISEQSGWLASPAFVCSTATTNVALLGGILALSLASGLRLIRHRSIESSPRPVPASTGTTGAMLLWVAWIGVILIATTDCLQPSVLLLSLSGAAGGAALGVLLVGGMTIRTNQWQSRLPFAVLAGVVAAPVGAQEANFVELAVLGALTGVSASLLMRFFDNRSMADIRLASALLVGGIFGTLAPVMFGPAGFLFVHSFDVLAPQLQGMGVALLLGLIAGRTLAWSINSTRFLRAPT